MRQHDITDLMSGIRIDARGRNRVLQSGPKHNTTGPYNNTPEDEILCTAHYAGRETRHLRSALATHKLKLFHIDCHRRTAQSARVKSSTFEFGDSATLDVSPGCDPIEALATIDFTAYE